jgi:Na+-driven multidrug efflux pump
VRNWFQTLLSQNSTCTRYTSAFGIAANVRVGNLLGGGDPAAARVAAAVSVVIGGGAAQVDSS